ncbi:MAG: hypothetical protein AB7V16_14350 [Vulcanibacillus sp.]
MNDLLQKVYEQKLTDGSFEAIISKQFDEMIKNVCNDLFSYNGAIKTEMKKQIAELMGGLIERTDFSQYVVKLETIINESLKNTKLEDYKRMVEGIKNICGVKKTKYGEIVNISDLLEKYGEFIKHEIEEDDFGVGEINTDDGTKNAYLECSFTVSEDEEKKGYFCKTDQTKIVTFDNEKSCDKEDTIIQFKLEKNYNGKYNVKIDKDWTIRDLRYMPEFVVYLLELETSSVEINIDKEYGTFEVEFEFEWECN